MSKKFLLITQLIILACIICGCSVKKVSRERLKDIEFTVMEADDIPQELKSAIDVKMKDGFMLTYQDNGYLYVAKGYGEMEGGSYCITVDDMYLTKNTVCVKFTIRGSDKEENESESTGGMTKEQSVTTPYIVIKCENPGKPVIFE